MSHIGEGMGDNAGMATVVTRSGRVVRPTEKVVENQAAARGGKPETSYTSTERQATDGARENAKKAQSAPSTVSGLSRLSKQTSSKQTSSSRRSEKRRDELARAHELSIKLQFLPKEEELQTQLETISREKRKLEIQRQCQEAIARAKVYDEDEPNQPTLHESAEALVEDRVRAYVMSQDPAYDIEDDQQLSTDIPNMPIENQQITAADMLIRLAPLTGSVHTPAPLHIAGAAHAVSLQSHTSAVGMTIPPVSAVTSTCAPVTSHSTTATYSAGLPSHTALPPTNISHRGSPGVDMRSTEVQPGMTITNISSLPQACTIPTHRCLNPSAAVYTPSYTGYNPSVQPQTANIQDQSINELARIFQQQMYISRLPPPEPGIFVGDPIQFPGWLSSFELLIESRQITAAERLHYLKRYLGGPAKECIEGFVVLATDDAYEEAKRLLKERFGDNFTVANAFRQKLRDWPKISGNDAAGLTKLSDFLQQCQAVMKRNDYLKILDDCHENQSILKKLPDWIIARWSRVVSDWTDIHGSFPPFSEFCRFVWKEARIANNPITGMQNVKLSGISTSKPEDNRPKRHVAATEANSKDNEQQNLQGTAGQRRARVCQLCSGDHHLDICPNFLKKTLAERTRYTRDSKLCFGCLKPNHLSKDCRSKMKCGVCSKSHPTSLHDDTRTMREESPDDTVTTERTTVGKTNVTNAKHSSSTSMIVPVYVSNRENPQTEQLVYAMLDTQSDASFITERTCNILQADGPTIDLMLSTMSSEGKVCQVKKISNLVVRGYNSNKRLDLPTVYTTAEVPGSRAHIPTFKTANLWPHLQPIAKNLPPLLNAEFGLLIGYNCSQALTPREVVASTTNPKEPYAQRTDLGWSIIGTSSERDARQSQSCDHATGTHSPGRASIALRTKAKEVFKPSDFARMSKLDCEFLEERKQSYEDLQFMRVLTENIHERNGHYEMPLPFKGKDPILPDNKDMAHKRLIQLKYRLQRDDNYRADYENFIQDLIDRGYCERAPDNHKHRHGTRWFIPHHGVYHPKKSKIRVVFDCSARYGGVSLNETLLQGPDMINDLIGVLCRFRKEPVAISCDIEKMFYQFYVNEEHRDYLSFLWWDNGDYDAEPSTYRMAVHLFGAVSSPGCANFGMNKIADDGEEQFGKPAADFVRDNFYVDDGLTSVPTVQHGKELISSTVQLCASKGLRLHKFVSNSAETLQSIPHEERSIDIKHLQFDHEPTVERTLGLQWCVQLDSFQFRIVLKDRPPTRRGMLSTVYSLFDPLGLLSPVVLVGRQILQDICREQYDWDSPLPESIVQRWEQWRRSLADLERVSIDRCYKPANFGDTVHVELHHFCDACTEGYGECSYIRLVDSDGHVHCSLVMAKSRVAPLKQVTVPRLELTAAVLSARTSALLRKQLNYADLTETFWCDSQVVLGYICNDAKKFHVFVANRVQQIRDITESNQWNYIRSQDNPADYASRGLSVEGLLDSFWLTGPAFLWRAGVHTNIIAKSVDVDDPELRKHALATNADHRFSSRFDYFSDWAKLKRAVASCRQYMSILKNRVTGYGGQDSTPIKNTVEDMEMAEISILRSIQREWFSDELTVLASNSKNRNTQKQLKRSHVLFQLDPFIDWQGVLRIGGRIQAASLSFGAKHPVVLPRQAHVSKLVAQYCHGTTGHQGRSMTMNEIRARGYWIIGCRSLVSSLINKCVPCKRLRGTVQEQKMADLPDDRVVPAPPFTYCAVDCFGPFHIKERRSVLKRYGVLFACMASRAVHLEVTNSMDTDSFINALRRFIAIRGPIRQLRSDMGSNFIGAKGELHICNNSKIKDYLMRQSCDYIEFKMNAPSASHMGGSWERQIRTVRSVLEGLLLSSGQQLDDESLRTLLYEVTAIVNSRPLTVNSLTDPAAVEPLTPNHLLHMKTKLVLPPPGEFQKPDLYLRRRWRRVQHLLNEFWSKWQNEYLLSLHRRQKWNTPKTDLQQGDIVIVRDENLPRNRWSLAIIEEVLPSADGKVRKVKLRVATHQLDSLGRQSQNPTYLERPIHKLVLLHRAPDV